MKIETDRLVIKHDLEVFSKEFNASLEKAVGRLVWKVAGFLVIQTAAIVTLIKLL